MPLFGYRVWCGVVVTAWALLQSLPVIAQTAERIPPDEAAEPATDAASAPEEVRRHLRVGASPRAMQAMIWAGKVTALMDDRKAVSIDDIRRVAYPALRHRLILKFEALAEGVPPDRLIEVILRKTALS